jgi:hypothetical protein
MSPSNRKKMFTLAWDVDDVLNNLMRVWLEAWWLPQHPGCMLNYEDIKKNPPHKLLGVDLDEYLQSLDEFRLSGHYEQMQPNIKALEWFEKYGSSFRHITVTSAPRIAASVSASWVIRHFGDWIRTFHFVPSLRRGEILPEYDTTKAACLSWVNSVDILIEDNEKNVTGLTKMGIQYFIVRRPWNSSLLKMEDLLNNLSQHLS